MRYQRVFIVIPTIRNLKFLRAWGSKFKNCTAVIVEDHETRLIEISQKYFKSVYHFTWQDIKKDFGADEWIFSRKNAGIRAYGFYKNPTTLRSRFFVPLCALRVH